MSRRAIVSRRAMIVAGLAVSLGVCAAGYSQNAAQSSAQNSPQSSSQNSPQKPQSLGDLARQARKDKPNSSTSKVFTNDDLGSSSSGGASGGSGNALKLALPSASAQTVAKPGGTDSAQTAIDKAEAQIKMLDAMDRDTLIRVALQGQDVSFPGRNAWENKLWTAKQVYVQQGRQFVDKSKGIVAAAQQLRDAHAGQELSPNDPQVQNFVAQLRQFLQDASRADAAFQSIVMEGLDLAKASGAAVNPQPAPAAHP